MMNEKHYWHKVKVYDPAAMRWSTLPCGGWADTLEEARLAGLDNVAALNDDLQAGLYPRDPQELQWIVDIANEIKEAIKDGYVPETDGGSSPVAIYEMAPDRKLRIQVFEWDRDYYIRNS